jgi:hypothetical protein
MEICQRKPAKEKDAGNYKNFGQTKKFNDSIITDIE